MDKGAVQEMIFGRWRSQTLYAGVKLGVFEALGQKEKDAALIAKELTLDPALSYRLASIGVFGIAQRARGPQVFPHVGGGISSSGPPGDDAWHGAPRRGPGALRHMEAPTRHGS